MPGRRGRFTGDLPAHANEEQFKKQAKELLRDVRAQDPEAIRRFGVFHPQLKKLRTRDLLKREVKLADAQVVISREHGFDHWSDLLAGIRNQQSTETRIPESADERRELFFDAGCAGDDMLVQRLLDRELALVEAVNAKQRTLLEELQHAQWWCEGLNPELKAVYRVLIKAGARPCLMTATRANDLPAVVELLTENPAAAVEVDYRICHVSPFVMAADNGHLAIVDHMLAVVQVPEDQIREAMGRTLLRNHFPVAERLLETGVAFVFDCQGSAEFQNPVGMRWELEHGADANHDNGKALELVISSYGRKIGPKHECIELLIEHEAKWTDDPVMAIHRGQVERLAAFLDEDPGLIDCRISLDYPVNLSLFEVTPLHIAAEFNEQECVDLLLDRGADLDARAGYAASGIGGQTPIFHTIGGNQGLVFPLFKHLLARGPDLTVEAKIQKDTLNMGRPIEGIETLTPLGYARRHADGPTWRASSREVTLLEQHSREGAE